MPYSLTRANQDQLLAAALALTKSVRWAEDAIAFAAYLNDEKEARAIGVFQNFAAGTAEIHFSMIGRPLTKKLLEAYMYVAFHRNGLRLNHLFATIDAANIRAQRAALGVGFQLEYRNRGTGPDGEDMVILSLKPDMVRSEPEQVSSAA